MTPVCIALEKISDTAAFCFLVTSSEPSSCFCIGLTVPAQFSELPKKLDSLAYVNKIDKLVQDKLVLTRGQTERLIKRRQLLAIEEIRATSDRP